VSKYPEPPPPDKVVTPEEDKTLTGDPGDKLWLAYFVAGAKALKLGDNVHARALLDLANKTAQSPADGDKRTCSIELSNSYFAEAELALIAKDFATAAADASAALQCDFKLFKSRNSASAADYELLGDIDVADGKTAAAETLYKLAIAMTSNRTISMQDIDTRVLQKLAALYQAMGRLDEANAMRPANSKSLLPCECIASHFNLAATNLKYKSDLWKLAKLGSPSVKSAVKPAAPVSAFRNRKARHHTAHEQV